MSELWWVSFADTESFRGLVIIPREKAEDIVALSRRLWMLGLNPGGEMFAAFTGPREIIDAGEGWMLEPENQGRLIPKAELAAKGYPPLGELDPRGFDREGFEADMATKTIEQGEADGAA